jgi:hypothetical protein
MKKSFLAVAAAAVLLAVSGCASAQPTVTSTPTPSKTSIVTMTPEQALASYKVLAQNSCNAAQSLGVVEKAADITIVSVNKNQNYKDFSAAYFQKPDTYTLIWELTSIAACADWYTFSMADEAGQDAGIKVTYDGKDGSYTAFQDLGEFGTSNFKYTVFDAKIATAQNLDPKSPGIVSIRYGNITPAERNILITAVDRYNATLGN